MSLFLFVGCDSSNSLDDKLLTHRWSGETMGTYYRVTVVEDKIENNVEDKTENNIGERASSFDIKNAKQLVEKQLAAVIASMSTYEADSELSVFNRLAANNCLVVSQDLLDVVQLSIILNAATAGAFNPLVGPLVERWGFGQSTAAFVYPEADEIASLLARADISALSINKDTHSLCKSADLAVDLSAIAKGYAVDLVAKQLTALSMTNYLVDIGGEVIVSGHNPHGVDWRLAIEKPVFRAGEIEQVVALNDVAIATSGDYRNFFEHQGKRYSHTIDVRTGYPVQHQLASVSVIASSAAEADAWATALNVMGPIEAKRVAAEQNLAVFLITRENAYKGEVEDNVEGNAESNVENNVEDNEQGNVEDNEKNSASVKNITWHSESFHPFILE